MKKKISIFLLNFYSNLFLNIVKTGQWFYWLVVSFTFIGHSVILSVNKSKYTFSGYFFFQTNINCELIPRCESIHFENNLFSIIKKTKIKKIEKEKQKKNNLKKTLEHFLQVSCPFFLFFSPTTHSTIRRIVKLLAGLLSFIQFIGWNKFDGSWIDTITFTCWFWSIIEYMSHVGTAFRTTYLSSYTVWVFKK